LPFLNLETRLNTKKDNGTFISMKYIVHT